MQPTPLDSSFCLLSSPWWHTFNSLVANAEVHLFLMAPYISRKPLERIHELLLVKPVAPTVQIVTCFSPDSLEGGSLDVGALQEFIGQHPSTVLHHIPKLHAKVYFNERETVITSANLTTNGLLQNREYGIHLDNLQVVQQVGRDMYDYVGLGTVITPETLARINLAVQAHQTAASPKAAGNLGQWQKLLPAQQAAITTELLTAQSHNESTQSILARTILYVLAKYGPLLTATIHDYVQQLQPELCSNLLDRVINGVHFGKKWKHHVRSAQAHLKRTGKITLTAGRWHRVDH